MRHCKGDWPVQLKNVTVTLPCPKVTEPFQIKATKEMPTKHNSTHSLTESLMGEKNTSKRQLGKYEIQYYIHVKCLEYAEVCIGKAL